MKSIPTPEDKPLYRDNIYSMTKYHQEEMVLLIGRTYGIPAVAPRFSATPGSVGRVPRVGEHDAEIRAELGL